MKKLKILIIITLLCSVIPTSFTAVDERSNEEPTVQTSVENGEANEETQSQTEEAKTSVFSATDFVVFLSDLTELSEQDVLDLAQVVTPDGLKAIVDQTMLAELKSASSEGDYLISIYLGEDSLTVKVTIKSTQVMIDPAYEAISPAYVAPVTLPAPINQAFPTPVIAQAIASAVYSNASAVGNTVSQAQLDTILSLTIGTFSGTLDLAELTAYGGFPFLNTFIITSYGTASFPANFNSTQFPRLQILKLNNLANNTLPDFELVALKELNVNTLNNITSIPDFSGLPALSKLLITSCASLVSVPDFSQLPNLTYLALTNLASLTVIPNFNYLPQLITLTTENTYLDTALDFSNLLNLTGLVHSSKGELPDYAHLPKLKQLTVSNGTFSIIPDFQYLPDLSFANLWTTSTSLSVPDFQHLPQMKTMSIRGRNDVTTTSPTQTVPDFSYMPLMDNLTITGYAITSVPDFSHMPVITSLTVNMTKLASVPDFSHMPLMNNLSLSSNLMTQVPDFQHMAVLDKLIISSTKIAQLPDFSNLLNLTELYVNSNLLTTLPDWNMPKLTKLYASNNLMTTISDFQYMGSLQSLNLAYNRLDTIPNLDLPNLTSLEINDNYLTVLPALDQLPKLSTFTVLNNRLIELPTRVLSFPVYNLVKQIRTISKTIEAGTSFTTDIPIVNQVAPKIPGFQIRTSTINGQTVALGSVSSAMVVPTENLGVGTHTVAIYMGPPSGPTDININYIITVVDTTPPVITSAPEITYESGTALPSESVFLAAINASAFDAVDGTLPVTVDLSGVNMGVVGTYTVTLRAEDLSGNEVTKDVEVHIVDTTPPVITSDPKITYEVSTSLPSESVFLAAINASALDAVDGTLPVTVDLSAVNMNVVGTYTVTLRAKDLSGNEVTKDVEVHIVDTTPPVITSDPKITYEVNTSLPSESVFLAAINASALDAVDGTLPVTVDLSGVNMNVVGTYTVTLRAVDLSGNEVTKDVEVHIVDTTPPVLTSDPKITYEVNTSLPSESVFLAAINASALDAVDGTLPVTVDLSAVNMNVVGTYTVTLRAVDLSGNEVTKDVEVHIVDTTPPVITSDPKITYEVNTSQPSEIDFLKQINASAFDAVDGTLPVTVDLSAVNMNIVGTYTVILRAVDLSGNVVTKEVEVHIVDTTPPVITSDPKITYEINTSQPSEIDFLKQINASAFDAVDGTLPVTVDLSAVNMNIVGTYTVTLRAVDLSGNVVTKEVEVHIVDTTPPVLTSDPKITYEVSTSLPSESDFLAAINASAFDAVDGTLPVTVDLSGVNMNVVGTYTVTLRAVDLSGNVVTLDVIVEIVDNSDFSYQKDDSTKLPDTGNSTSTIMVSALLIGFGSLILFFRRKRTFKKL